MEVELVKLLTSFGDLALVVIAMILVWGTPKIVSCFIKIERRMTKLETAFEIHMEGLKNVDLVKKTL